MAAAEAVVKRVLRPADASWKGLVAACADPDSQRSFALCAVERSAIELVATSNSHAYALAGTLRELGNLAYRARVAGRVPRARFRAHMLASTPSKRAISSPAYRAREDALIRAGCIARDGEDLVLLRWRLANASPEEMARRRASEREGNAERQRRFRAKRRTARQEVSMPRLNPAQVRTLRDIWGMDEDEIREVEAEWSAAPQRRREGKSCSLGGPKTAEIPAPSAAVTLLLNTDPIGSPNGVAPAIAEAPPFGDAKASKAPPPSASSSPTGSEASGEEVLSWLESPRLRALASAPVVEEPPKPAARPAPPVETAAPPPPAPRRPVSVGRPASRKQVRELLALHRGKLGSDVNVGAIANTRAPYSVVREAIETAAENASAARNGRRVRSPGAYIVGLIRRRLVA